MMALDEEKRKEEAKKKLLNKRIIKAIPNVITK